MVINLTALAEARAKMTTGAYTNRGVSISTDGRTLAVLNSIPTARSIGHASGGTDSDAPSEFAIGRANAAGIVATHNAADVLIEIARCALEWQTSSQIPARAARVRLLAALAKVSL